MGTNVVFYTKDRPGLAQELTHALGSEDWEYDYVEPGCWWITNGILFLGTLCRIGLDLNWQRFCARKLSELSHANVYRMPDNMDDIDAKLKGSPFFKRKLEEE